MLLYWGLSFESCESRPRTACVNRVFQPLSCAPSQRAAPVFSCRGTMMSDANLHLQLAAQIVAAYVGRHAVEASELPALIGQVHAAVARVAAQAAGAVAPPRPAAPARRSVFDDYIVCLEDGKKFKSLKRHLRTQYGMTPERYREKWGLPPDYPMVAPNYAKKRSQLARNMGLGQQKKAQRPR